MDLTLGSNSKVLKPRLRCYSSMNYNQYQDFFGTPPKMPEPPNSKPLEDPLDIPFLNLQTEAPEEEQQPQNKNHRKLIYNMDIIPEVDSSEANSIGINSPRHKMEFFKFNNSGKMEDELDDSLELRSVKRRRPRPRCMSENNMFHSKTRILDFLSEYRNKQVSGQLRGRKQVKLQ